MVRTSRLRGHCSHPGIDCSHPVLHTAITGAHPTSPLPPGPAKPALRSLCCAPSTLTKVRAAAEASCRPRVPFLPPSPSRPSPPASSASSLPSAAGSVLAQTTALSPTDNVWPWIQVILQAAAPRQFLAAGRHSATGECNCWARKCALLPALLLLALHLSTWSSSAVFPLASILLPAGLASRKHRSASGAGHLTRIPFAHSRGRLSARSSHAQVCLCAQAVGAIQPSADRQVAAGDSLLLACPIPQPAARLAALRATHTALRRLCWLKPPFALHLRVLGMLPAPSPPCLQAVR